MGQDGSDMSSTGSNIAGQTGSRQNFISTLFKEADVNLAGLRILSAGLWLFFLENAAQSWGKL